MKHLVRNFVMLLLVVTGVVLPSTAHASPQPPDTYAFRWVVRFDEARGGMTLSELSAFPTKDLELTANFLPLSEPEVVNMTLGPKPSTRIYDATGGPSHVWIFSVRNPRDRAFGKFFAATGWKHEVCDGPTTGFNMDDKAGLYLSWVKNTTGRDLYYLANGNWITLYAGASVSLNEYDKRDLVLYIRPAAEISNECVFISWDWGHWLYEQWFPMIGPAAIR